MKIDKSKIKLVFEFSADDWFLCKCDDEVLGDYSLNYRIDRSEKGKSDDIGVPKIYLTEEEAEEARKNGFSEIL